MTYSLEKAFYVLPGILDRVKRSTSMTAMMGLYETLYGRGDEMLPILTVLAQENSSVIYSIQDPLIVLSGLSGIDRKTLKRIYEESKGDLQPFVRGYINNKKIRVYRVATVTKNVVNPIDCYDRDLLLDIICRAAKTAFGFDVNPSDILSKKKNGDIVLLRHIAAYILRSERFEYKKIMEMLKRKDHTTVMNSYKKISEAMGIPPEKYLSDIGYLVKLAGESRKTNNLFRFPEIDELNPLGTLEELYQILKDKKPEILARVDINVRRKLGGFVKLFIMDLEPCATTRLDLGDEQVLRDDDYQVLRLNGTEISINASDLHREEFRQFMKKRQDILALLKELERF